MPGTSAFTRVAMAKETTKGTPTAPTRRFYGVAVGSFEPGFDLEYHEDAARSVKTRAGRVPTLVREAPTFRLQDAAGIGYDDFVQLFSMGLRGGQTGTGATADKTWTLASQNVATNAYEAMTLDVGDDTQNYRLQYVQPTSWTISTDGRLTRMTAECFAQRAVKGAAATPAETSPIQIPSDLWTVKFATAASGLTGASVNLNFLRSWSLQWNTGLSPEFYLDGTLYMGQSVETDLSGTLSLEVDSTTLAVSEFYDKHAAGTLDFVRLKAIGPVLGATFYSLQFDIPVYWDSVKPLASQTNAINRYTVTGKVAYDPATSKSLEAILVCSLTAIP